MAIITQGMIGIILGQTVYWQGAKVEFHGFLATTDASVIRVNEKALTVVATSELTTTMMG